MAELTAVAECKLGYPLDQVEQILGAHADRFSEWMRGQTGAICEGQAWDHELKCYYPTNCGPHGPVVYGHDLRRWMAGERHIYD